MRQVSKRSRGFVFAAGLLNPYRFGGTGSGGDHRAQPVCRLRMSFSVAGPAGQVHTRRG
jgi:hypothetical protein